VPDRRDYCLWLILHDEVTGVELEFRVRCVHEFSLQYEGVFAPCIFPAYQGSAPRDQFALDSPHRH